MKYLLVDERIRDIEKQTLNKLGYNIIKIKHSSKVYPEISSHVDIFACKIGKKLIVEKSQLKELKQILQSNQYLEEGQEEVGEYYPEDIKYNVCLIGKKAVHNFKFTDAKIKQELICQGYELINTNQGYTNCSIVVVDEKNIITADIGLYKTLEQQDINILFLDYEPDIKLLKKENEYSNKKGFMGGAITRVENKMVVFGDLKKIDKNNKIRNFIRQNGLEIIEFNGLDVIDYGGMIVI